MDEDEAIEAFLSGDIPETCLVCKEPIDEDEETVYVTAEKFPDDKQYPCHRWCAAKVT